MVWVQVRPDMSLHIGQVYSWDANEGSIPSPRKADPGSRSGLLSRTGYRGIACATNLN